MDILESTENLCREILETEELEEATNLRSYLSKQAWSCDDQNNVLSELSNILLYDKWTLSVAENFSPLILDLLNRCAPTSFQDASSISKHEYLCIALGRLIWSIPDAVKFAKSYFERAPSLWVRFCDGRRDPPKKKAKKMQRKRADLKKLLQTGLQFLMLDVKYFKDLWDWSSLIQLVNSEDLSVKWLTYYCLSVIGGFSKVQFKELFELDSSEGKEEFSTIWHGPLFYRNSNSITFKLASENLSQEDSCDKIQRMGAITERDLHYSTAVVEGVLLNRMHMNGEKEESHDVVLVPSVQEALHELALAISANEAVMLQGPVGCGKTTLVEYLAQMTGRQRQKDLLKIQLGDRMDSKLLIGSHCCTEIPGKFVWQPGVLTEAMILGHWLLLEDIDCASMDVVSTLIPVLQSRSIILPGCDHPIKAAGGFQLFATQRLLSGHGGTYVEFRSNVEVLDKLWRKITVSALSREELQTVISAKWPVLETIIDRILEVYFMVLTGTNDGDSADSQIVLSAHGGRMVSTRDLFKWCQRVAEKVKCKNSDAAISIFKAAMDYFCQSIPIMDDRIAVAASIAVKFNISSTMAEHFCKNYKPEIKILQEYVEIGGAVLRKKPVNSNLKQRPRRYVFAHTRQSVALLEKVASAVQNREPVLLVGETGTGKTSIIQYLADITNNDFIVVNMNQQSDSIDLLGGYKPVDLKLVITPLKQEYEKIFCETFSQKQNTKFLMHIMKLFQMKRWGDLFTLMMHTYHEAIKRINSKTYTYPDAANLLRRWKKLGTRISQLRPQVKDASKASVFTFIEGTLVKAMKEGKWILLDEINLAEAETLECFAGVLDRADDSLFLLEKGDKEPVTRHPNFHVFACMNPATDVGKKDLPVGVRNRFTEFYVEELEDRNDLLTLVDAYLHGLTLHSDAVENIVDFYFHIRKKAAETLSDGNAHNPHYSLRTLCRALRVAARNTCECVPRSLYEAFCLSFLSQLDQASHPDVKASILHFILTKKKQQSLLQRRIPQPREGNYLSCEGYWISVGTIEPHYPDNYTLTPAVRRNLQDLARIVSVGRYPVLLQGDTSVGKTSLVQWLAEATGNRCVRVNNHEHTDIQEYVGSYTANNEGKLVFKEGVLVEAMRNGYWIILDELNLAPTEVMEALNRVLDDNRELFITETQEVVRAHSKFMVFATQNPPGVYGGRKILSRAFRNRFVELHFSQIPPQELETILEKRCLMPLSYCKRLVAIMTELQLHRCARGVFAGNQAYFTLRDLFRWGERYRLASEQGSKFYDWNQHLGEEGYMLLAGRVRRPEEEKVIREVIEKHIKCTIDPSQLFNIGEKTSLSTSSMLNDIVSKTHSTEFKHIVWTDNMRRLAVLVGQAMRFNEPVLLVGDTGCGKTTVCQLLSVVAERTLHTVNCHMHTESSDFLGSLRPFRGQHMDEDQQKLFEWVDGPLVKAMKMGHYFLVDEISLAEDSVLERLNSLLEPERTVLLTEKCGDDDGEPICVKADGQFRIFATMNPGGDFGKKELSPALRNRFTEIWCPSSLTEMDLVCIIQHNIVPNLSLGFSSEDDNGFGCAMSDFLDWFRSHDYGKRFVVSIRDILSWVDFINRTTSSEDNAVILTPSEAYIHGACLVYLDSIGAGGTATWDKNALLAFKEECVRFLILQVKELTGEDADIDSCAEYKSDFLSSSLEVRYGFEYFGVGSFQIKCGPNVCPRPINSDYTLESPTTKTNVFRTLRALQVSKPILLEGTPGVGKTSLVTAIARASGNQLVRINLSEQTDITDLFGADLPFEGGSGGEFAWRDGPLLQALKNGHWVLLDELNLASQSVLEGLNACLDHRGEVFVPELNETFFIQSNNTRIFGCQNPYADGGARKGLPRSFLNRFTQVCVEPFTSTDLIFISYSMYPAIPQQLIESMVNFNNQIVKEVSEERLWGQDGYPWEFNLRDIFRWCEVMLINQDADHFNPGEYVSLIYGDRMRTKTDKDKVYEVYNDFFGEDHPIPRGPLILEVTSGNVQLGHSFLPRHGGKYLPGKDYYPLHFQMPALESLMKCMELGWMAILLGPTGCGKTSIVHHLASLVGHPLDVLSMNSELDTTELLGGFEQADFTRHIDGVYEELSTIFWDLSHPSMVCNDDEMLKVAKVLSKQAEFEQLRRTRSEKKVLGLQIDCLKYIASVLDEFSLTVQDVSDLLECKEALDEISKKLSDANGSFSGGKFEWVDSILVRAVKKGHWLLVENANFCSASVLDRLNGLLEPGGVLTINEQGAVGDELVTITPHEDFRIVLTMDSKKGEISRAMRNRGVEIAIVSEGVCLQDKSKGPDIWDILAMLHSRHLTHPELMEILLKIHQELVIANYSNVTFCDLLACASLIMQNIQHKADLQTALWNSVTAVYVKPVLNHSAREDTENVIRDIMEKLLNFKIDLNTVSSPQLYQSSLDYQMDEKLASMKQKGMIFPYMVHQMICFIQRKPIFKEVPFHFESLYSGSSPREWVKAIIFSMRIALEKFSFGNWNCVSSWMKHCFSEAGNMDVAETQCFRYVDQLKNLFLNQILEPMAFPAVQELKDNVYKLIETSSLPNIDKDDISWDPRCNPIFFDKLLVDLKGSADNMNIEYVKEKVAALANRFHLLLTLCRFQVEVHSAVYLKNRSMSLLSLSRDFGKKMITLEQLPHAVIAHLCPFFINFHDAVKNFLNQEYLLCPDDLYWEMWRTLHIYYSIVRVCCETCNEQPSMSDQVSRLILLWPSVLKKVLNIFDLRYGHGRVPADLMTSALRISHELGLNFPNDHKVRSKLVKFLGFPSALPKKEAAKVYEDVVKLSSAVSLPVMVKTMPNNLENIKLAICQGGHWSQTLSNAFCTSLNKQSNHSQLVSERNAVHQVELQLYEVGLLQNSDEDVMEVCDDVLVVPQITSEQLVVNLQLLPLWDYLFVLTETEMMALASNTLSTNQLDDSKHDSLENSGLQTPLVNFLIDVGISKLNLDPVHIGILLSSKSKNTKNNFSELLVSFLDNARSGLSSSGLMSCLLRNPNGNVLPESLEQSKISWTNLSPILTYICYNILSGMKIQGASEVTMTLGMGIEKGKQVESVKRLLWRNSDSLQNKGKLFWKNTATVVTSWFDSLISAIAAFSKVSLTSSEINPSDLVGLSSKLGLSTKMFLVDNTDLLLLTAENIQSLKTQLENSDGKPQTVQWIIGKCYTYVGLLTLFLLAPTDSADPVKKCEVKSSCCGAMLHDVQMEKHLRNLDCVLSTGNSLTSYRFSELHPFITALFDNERSLLEKLEELKTKLAYRPFPQQFNGLRSEIRQYLQSFGSPSCISENAKKLESLKHQLELGNLNEAEFSKSLMEVQRFSENQMNFVSRIKENYPLYRDLTFPFLAGVEQMLLGIKMMSHFVSYSKVFSNFPAKNFSSIEEFLVQLASFPPMNQNGEIMRPLEVSSFLCDERNVQGIHYLSSFGNVQQVTLKAMKCAILEAQNEILINKTTSPDNVFPVISSIFKTYCETWIQKDFELKLKKELEENLYEHKTQNMGEDITDEESILREVKAMFPSYEEEFSEFLPTDSEIHHGMKSHTPFLSEQIENPLCDKDVMEVWSMHAALIASMSNVPDSTTKSELSNMGMKSPDTPDFATPYHLRYEILKPIILATGDKLGNVLDWKLLNGHLLASSMSKSLMNVSSEQWSGVNKYYDIYHDSNPPEVLECRPLLENLSSRIGSLLQQFPDNPSLIQILKIINRILSFSVFCPLMKYVTGLELILESSQDWEQNAHKGISLNQELSEITRKIIQCRKIELNCWRQCLNNVVKKQYMKCAKWWIYLYSLIAYAVDVKVKTNKEECEEVCGDSMVKSLQKFMEESQIGQFCARLDLLHTFLLHVLMSPPSSSKRKISAILFNVYNFYKQFLPSITKKISGLRTPIEKEIKDYVKISRWSELNFAAVKQAVEKSHRTIHKHMKKFENELEKPAKSVFHVPSKMDSEESKSIQWSLDIEAEHFTSKLMLPKFSPLTGKSKKSKELYFEPKLPRFHKKTNKFCAIIMDSHPVVECINNLNSISGEIIETAQELESLEVSKNANKDRQRKEAKQIHSQKRKMLAILFKDLDILGLSYGRGLIYCRNQNVNEAIFTPFLDLNEFSNSIKNKFAGEIVKACCSGINHYFYKCVGQYPMLMSALQSPSEDLTFEIIQKTQGFSGDLMQLAVSQRHAIAKEIDDLNKLRVGVMSLLAVSQGKASMKKQNVCLPSQLFLTQWRATLCNIVIQTVAALQQFIILMECCPLPSEEVVYDMDLPECLPPLASATKRDCVWTTTVDQTQKCLDKAKSIISKIAPELDSKNMFLTWKELKVIEDGFCSLSSLAEDIAVLEKGIEQDGKTNYFTQNLQSISFLIANESTKFYTESVAMKKEAKLPRKPNCESIIKHNESSKLLKSVLIAVQEVLTLCRDHTSEILQLENVKEKLISENINAFLHKTSAILSVHRIRKSLKKLLKHLKKSQDPLDVENSVRMLCQMAPILFQYVQLVEFHITVALGMHRTTCKTLSILMGIFTTLSQKGFCLPQESQEKEDGGGTEFHNIEDGGLGDGEGAKNVSDKIESEDQLDDAMKEGADKAEEESDQPDIKEEDDGIEMSEDFDGKLHDPDAKDPDGNDDDNDDDGSDQELDKKMGDVNSNQSDNLDEKLWGSDSEDEDEELNEDENNEGDVQNEISELVAKDEKQEGHEESDNKKERKPPQPNDQNKLQDEEEYDGEHADPLINEQPDDEPEIMELPNEMHVGDKEDQKDSDDGDGDDEQNEFDIDAIKESHDQGSENGEGEEENVDESKGDVEEILPEEPMEEGDNEGDNDGEKCPDQEADNEDINMEDMSKNDQANLQSQDEAMESEALAAEDVSKYSSNDKVKSGEDVMNFEGGGGESEDQHKEGQADAKNSDNHETGHDGSKTTAAHDLADSDKEHKQRLKRADENRSLGSAKDRCPENVNIAKKKENSKMKERKGLSKSDLYEHIQDEDKADCETIDIATEEQALSQPVASQDKPEKNSDVEEDDDVIAVDDSDDEEEEESDQITGRTFKGRHGGHGNEEDSNEDDEEDDDEEEDDDSDMSGDHITTLGASHGPCSTIHTQYDLWTTLCQPDVEKDRSEMEQDLEQFCVKQKEGVTLDSRTIQDMWQKCENIVSPLVHDLCEQLRLVLEPTKMTKLKGDYRSGKRLNMRKIIPYIASQFRKDKIWLRRTKPSKRQYQIMLAIDDSSSMTDNHSKQMAFESLALISKSLSLIEAGELSVVSFGEDVKLLNSFSEPFTNATGCHILQELTFSQNKTRFKQLLDHATDLMLQAAASSSSRLISKEVAQLLIIISDGQGVFGEGEQAVISAVRRARDNNIFMVFVVLDNAENKKSILETNTALIDDEGKFIKFIPYMSRFPFPFYILLREINSLPLVLGEALRKWFELVTSVDR